MKRSNNFRRTLRAAAVMLVAAILSFAGCTTVDDTLGSNLVPNNEQMKAGYTTIGARLANGDLNPKKYVETRLFQTDSIISSNISYGYMGSMVNDTFGMRTAGFLSQYLSYYKVPAGYFGYMPIFDSVQLIVSIKSYGGDTTAVQQFAVYEITSNDYLTDKPVNPKTGKRDTTFYVNYDIEGAGIVGDKLFTFELGGSKGPATTAVTMTPTQEGKDFISRLMLQSGKYKDNYSIYASDSLKYFVEEFKGVYIRPEQDAVTGGAVYATTLSSSGISIYGRNRVKSDPTLIKDTIGLVLYFYDSTSEKYGNVSVNSIRHDWTGAQFNIADAVETNTARPTNNTIYVEGMGGVISEITFTQEFFDELQQILDTENAQSGKDFTSFAFSQVQMSICFTGATYDWHDMLDADLSGLIPQMNAAQKRLGMYTDFKMLTAVSDYAYVYENTYGTTLAYNGYINRSRGCYLMNITGHLQTVWNNYMKEVKDAKKQNRAVNLDNVGKRSIYLGPEAYGLYTEAYSVVQGQTPDGLTAGDAPIKIELLYNMIK